MLKKSLLTIATLITLSLFAFRPSGQAQLPIHKNLASNTSTEAVISLITEKLATNPAIGLPNQAAITIGVTGYLKLVKKGLIAINKPLTIIDFSLPSSEKRLWTIDMVSGAILHHTWVAHGRNSGQLMAKNFSNTNSSYMSSLGFYKTSETYQGKHGYSLRLDGLEKGLNDNARTRAIVIHGADYANPEFIEKTGRLGRSLGCPALPMDQYQEIIDTIKEDGCLYIYATDQKYLKSSAFIPQNSDSNLIASN